VFYASVFKNEPKPTKSHLNLFLKPKEFLTSLENIQKNVFGYFHESLKENFFQVKTFLHKKEI